MTARGVARAVNSCQIGVIGLTHSANGDRVMFKYR